MTRHISFRKSIKLLAAPILGISLGLSFTSCEDNVPVVGSDLATGEVQIALDSLIWDGTTQLIYRGDQKFEIECPRISYITEFDNAVDTRSTTNLIGRINVKEYGDLRCSFVSQLMSAKRLDIPDTIPVSQVDSMKLIFYVKRGALTGDSLAPQQLKVFDLTQSLPKDIKGNFNPTGYYDPETPLGSRSFTLSALGMSDSLYTKNTYINIEIPLPKEKAVEVVKAYRNDATKSIFEWPQTFENYFHGIYVEPTFGRGCVANISSTNFVIYYNYKTQEKVTVDGVSTSKEKTKIGSTGVFASSPIVLSSNNIKYTPSDYLNNLARNEAVITTPGGFRVKLKFPAKELLDIYFRTQSKLSVVSDLTFSIPVEEIKNDYGLTPPPYLVLVKSSKLEEFLANNSLPDDKDSFYAEYKSKLKRYTFSSMRNYILGLIRNGVNEDDLDFTIIPANMEFEEKQASNNYNNYWNALYGYDTSSSDDSSPIKCTPYISKPSMCKLRMDKARTIFTYTLQQMK